MRSVILFLAGILVLTLAMVQASNAQTRRAGYSDAAPDPLCTSVDTKVIVKLATAPTQYNTTIDARGLTGVHNTGRGTTLGLAGGPIDINMSGQYEIRSREGKVCVHLSAIEITFWAKPEVMIASNYERNSCEYKAILGHEQKHIRALRKFVRSYAPKLRNEVKDIIATSRTRVLTTEDKIDAAQDKIQTPIVARLRGYQAQIMPILANTQADIDSAQEYQDVAASCDNW